jgi:hypothetical protein
MKEILEKIIFDSTKNVADNIINELSSNDSQKYVKNEKVEKYYNENKKDDSSDCEKDYNSSANEHTERNHSNNNVNLINAYSRNKRLNIMVISAAIGLIFCMLVLTTYKGDLPGEVVGIISTVSGIFGACLKDAYSFEFGSSRGSKDKDDKISAAILERLRR